MTFLYIDCNSSNSIGGVMVSQTPDSFRTSSEY